MDVQALFEGSVVLSDEDGPGRTEKKKKKKLIVENTNTYNSANSSTVQFSLMVSEQSL